MGKGIVKLGEGQWATKDGKLLAAKETNGRFKNAEFTVTRGSDATYTDKDGLIKRVSAPRNRNTTSSNTLDLFVLAGQSNAMGWLGNASGYPPQEPDLLDSSIKLNYEQIGTTSKSDGWQTLGPQQRQNYGEIFGPEVTFSRLLKRGGYNPAIFKYTEGSTSLADDWRAPGQSGHYDTMVTKFNAAVLDLQNQGYTVNIAGFIWIQGEQDATDATDASNYQSNLNAIISDFRTNVASNSTLEFVLGVDEGNPASNISAIVTAQTNIANGDANIVRSSMVGLEKADSTHLTPAGIIDHGKRIYDSMFDLASAEPRIDFTNNTDGHLLLEPQSTNLITYSEDFSVWNTNGATTIPNDSISPSGILNAAKIKPTQANGVHLIGFNVTSSNVKTYSVFAKQNGYTRFRFNTGSSSNGFASFNLSNGSVAASGGTYYSSSNIENYGNGWYRCSVTFLANAPNNFSIVVEDSSAHVSFVGDGVSSIYVWGAQVEEQSYATSYIPTNGGTVTRDADVVSRLGIDEIDIPQEEGTIYLELKGYEKNTEIFNFNRSTSNSIHVFTNSAGALRVITYYEPEGTGTSANVTLNNNTNKVAIAFKNGSFIVYADGEEELNTSTFVWTPTTSINRLHFNEGGYVAQQGLSKVKALKIYKEAFNTTQLDELTS